MQILKDQMWQILSEVVARKWWWLRKAMVVCGSIGVGLVKIGES
jgi:hypothetical protein